MNNNEILFQALAPIGAMPSYYNYTDTATSFTKLIWTDNTIKQQPNEAAKSLISHLFQSISISSTCVYGVPKDAKYPTYICPASSSAAAYNFYVSSIISNLSALPSFLNIIRSNIEGIINGTTTEAVFYDTCFSLLKINNFTHFLVEAADPLTKNFSDTITIQPLLPQVDQIFNAVKEIVAKSDQLRSIIINKTATPQDVLTYNDTINSFINIIPQYTQAYSNLLIQLQNEFIEMYNKDKVDKESENKSSDKKNIDTEFDLFTKKMKSYINPIQKVILLSIVLLSQKPFSGVCDNLLISLKSIVDNANTMIINYSKLFHFRGDEFELYKNNFLDSENKNLTLLQEVKTQFTTILSTDTPPAFQVYMNEELKTSLDIINNNGQNSISIEIKNEFEKILKLIQNDSRSVVFSPILATSIPTNQFNALSLKSIRILHSLILELRINPINFQNIKDRLNDLHPAINLLLTVVYNDTYIKMTNEINKSKSGKKKKIKASNFTLQPEIVVLNQKKTYIQNLFVSFDESLRKLSPESKILRIVQDNCTLKAILLTMAISTLESGPNIQNEIAQIKSILVDILDNYYIDNESTIKEIIQFFDDEKNIPNEHKAQFETVVKNLKETIQFTEKVFKEEKRINEADKQQIRIDIIMKKITEYRKLSLLLSSLQYIDESYFPDNRYHETVSILQQNITNIVKNYQNASQLFAYQNFMCLSKVFHLILNLLRNVLPHSSSYSNYSNLILSDLNRNRTNMASLSICGIGFDPESSDILKKEIDTDLIYLKNQKEFYETKVDQDFFKNNLSKSFKTFDEFYEKTEQSVAYLEICNFNDKDVQKERIKCIAPILKHFTLHINYNLDKYALAFINNLPTIVQLAMKLNDLLRELNDALRYIPDDDLELEKVQNKFKYPGNILFQRTSEIPLLTDYFKDDKTSLNIALQNKKEIIKEAISNVMNFLSIIVKSTTREISKFEEETELKRQRSEFDKMAEQIQKEYEEDRKKQLANAQDIENYRKEIQEKEKISDLKKKDDKIDYKEPSSFNINPIFGMGLYLKCGFNPDKLKLDPDSESDIDLSIDIEALSNFSSIDSLNTSVFKNAESSRSENDISKNKENKNIDIISDLQKQLMPPDYLLTAIQCGLLKETQDNMNDDLMNEDDEGDDDENDDPVNALKLGGLGGVDDDDDEDENEDDEKSGDFDTENDPILGNKELIEDDDDFFESCSDDDDEEEEEKHKGFFPWS